MSSASQSASLGDQRSTGISKEDRTSLNEAQRVLDSVASNEGVNSSLLLQAGIAANLGLSKGEFLKLGAAADGGGRLNASSNESYNRAWDAAQSQEVQRSLSTVERVGENSSWGSTGSYGDSANAGDRFSIDEGQRMAATYARQLREADAYSKAASDVQSSSVVSDTQLGVFVQDALGDIFPGPQGRQKISDILTARDFTALSKQDQVLEEVVGDLMTHYGVGGAVTDQTQGFNATSHYAPEDRATLPDTVGPIRDGVVSGALGTTRHMDDVEGRINNGQDITKQGFDGHWGANRNRNEAGQGRSLGEVGYDRAKDVARQTANAVTGDYPASAESNAMTAPMSLPGEIPEVPILPSTPLSPPPPMQRWFEGSVDNGFYRNSNISYDLDTSVRNQAPQPELMADISQSASQLGPDIGVIVRSAGQPSFGSNRVGSPRHDHGNAVDIQLTKGGEPIRPSDNPALYSAFIERAAQNNPGIGHYDWGLHIGGGQPAFWGPDKTVSTADPTFRAAYDRGRNS